MVTEEVGALERQLPTCLDPQAPGVGTMHKDFDLGNLPETEEWEEKLKGNLRTWINVYSPVSGL